MGVGAFDVFSIGHFLSGFVANKVIAPGDPNKSFIISNGVHFCMEVCEVHKHPVGGHVLESMQNHLTDIVFFAVGWGVGEYIEWRPSPQVSKPLFALLVLVMVQEIGREIFPKSWPVDAAYGGDA